MRQSKRLAWVDNVKMVAMLFVILGHTWRIIHYPLPEYLGLFILSFNMALFVIMTGFTSVHSIDKIETTKDLKDYIEKITKRILLPSTVFNSFLSLLVIIEKFILDEEVSLKYGILMLTILVVYIVAFFYRKYLYGRRFFLVLCILAIPLSLKFSSFWFLNMIWCVCISVSLASFCQKKLMCMEGAFVLYLIAFMISLLFNYAHDKTSDFIHFFLIGYAISKFNLLSHFRNIVFVGLCLLLGLLIVSTIGEDGMNFWEYHFIEFLFSNSLHIYLLRLLASTLISMSFILLIEKLSKEYNKFSFWGSKALPLYMVHALFINIFYNLPISYELDGLYYILYAVPATVLLALLSMVVIKYFMRYELTQTYCLGELR